MIVNKGVKTLGVISWEIQPGYPKLTNNDGGKEVQVNYLINESEISSLPEIGNDFIDSRFPVFANLGVRLSKLVLTPKPGGVFWLLEETFSSPGNSTGENPDVEEAIEYSTEDYEKPLESCEKYRTCWNYVLLRKDNHSGTVTDSWWKNAVNTQIPDDYKGNFMWCKATDCIPDGWHVLKSETKKGATGRLSGAVVVTVTRKANSKNLLARQAQKDYTKQTPPDNFGRSGVWLRCGSSIRKEGKKWVSVVQYRNFDKIDPDLYD